VQLFGASPNTRIVYLPYDLPDALARFFARFRPVQGVLLETEIWPNLMAAAARRACPLMLANARLSRRSARAYARIGALIRPAFRRLSACAAQTRADAARLKFLGAPRVAVCGNLKFDVAPDPALLVRGEAWRKMAGARPVFLAASTREGEERLVLNAWRDLAHPDALLVLAPRHPERCAAIAALAREYGLAPVRRSVSPPAPETRLWLMDGLGELAACYRMADAAFIGGSLMPLGGQNLIEAAACGCPALVGAYTFNFARATQEAIAAGAAWRVSAPDDLAPAIRRLLADAPQRQRMAAAGRAFAAAHRGAAKRIMALLTRPENAPHPYQ
jgi:3-deoxy-D-manno-octulosonic-acid transferase